MRRIFAILVQEGDVLEWSKRGGQWKALGGDDVIRDRAFKKGLHVKALLDAAAADRLVGEALVAKGEPHLMGVIKEREDEAQAKGRAKGRAEGETKGRAKGRAEGLAEGETKGRAEGLAEAILRVFKSHSIQLDAENRRALLDCRDTALLGRLLDMALAADSASDVLAELEKTR